MGELDALRCPQCKVGFAPGTRLCPICKIGLISDYESNVTAAPVDLSIDLSSLQFLRTDTVAWIQNLLEKLEQAGIPYWTVVMDRRHPKLSVYVRPDDFQRAMNINHEVFRTQVPGTEKVQPVERLDFWSCPGCGERLGEKDRECTSCGLVLFQTDGWRCSHCNGAVEVDVEVCPHCGGGIDWNKA